MTITTLKEIKDNENRVGITPEGTRALTEKGHQVIVQRSAGLGAGFSDEEYEKVGAEIYETPEEIVRKSDILVKVKEPLPEEYPLLKLMNGKALFTYLHLSGVEKELTVHLLLNHITAVAYETVEDNVGRLPLLTPMSIVAGVLAVQYAAQYMQMKYGGRGMTLSEIPGTKRAHVLVIGGGVVGWAAAKTAVKAGSDVHLLDINEGVLKRLKSEVQFLCTDDEKDRFHLTHSNKETLHRLLQECDVLIGAVLVTGTKAPKVVTEEEVRLMKRGAVIVDVSIDQGGCIWGSQPTSHTHPIYERDGKIYCCITNMPGQAPRQSTQALTSATIPYLLKLAEEGVLPALRKDPGFAKGVNTFGGRITCKSVAEDLDMMEKYVELASLASLASLGTH